MSKMTFYLKYRPQKLDELDLKDVRERLVNIVKSKKIPHALLFSGPKGSGKTSAARIIAKIVNCERRNRKNPPADGVPCNKCDQCISIINGNNIDVIELDAASHRGIDDVRVLRDAVKLTPASAKMKVYIIDEAHMLTTEASNALLKTLEEPPPHVMFILATTNPEKLIDTIRSRSLNVVFRKATAEEITRSLDRVVRGEKLKSDNGVQELIAKATDGSFRDAVKILEELAYENKNLEVDKVGEFLFSKKSFEDNLFFDYLAKKDVKKTFSLIESAVDKGVSAKVISETIIRRLRNAYLSKIGLEGEKLDSFNKNELVSLIKLFSQAASDVSSSVIEQLPIEVAVGEWCDKKLKDKQNLVLQAQSSKFKDEEDDINKVKTISKDADDDLKPKTLKASNENNFTKNTSKNNSISENVWAKILGAIRPQNTSTEALLRAARPMNYNGNILEIGVFYRFHKERLETIQHKRLVEDVASEILGNGVKIVCTLTEQTGKEISKDEVNKNTFLSGTDKDTSLSDAEDKDIVKVAKEIFGS